MFFVICLALVSVIKNKTRNLQKEINNLHASINQIEIDLHNATIKASNRQDKKGASMEIEFPKV